MAENPFDNMQQSIKLGIKENMHVWHSSQWLEEHTKYEYTIWSVMRGNIYINVNGSDYTLSKGDAVLFTPGTICTAHSDGDGCEFMFEQFYLEMGNSMNVLNGMNLCGILPKKHIGTLCGKFCAAAYTGRSYTSDFSLKFYALFLPYIEKILTLVQKGALTPFFANVAASPASGIWRAASYISENFLDEFSMSECAATFGFSEKYFITQFRAALGITPKQYLIDCRMRYAAHTLLHSQKRIQDIALYVRYSDLYSFSKAFKKHFGASPAAYRRMHTP